jgi:hypothetical protein
LPGGRFDGDVEGGRGPVLGVDAGDGVVLGLSGRGAPGGGGVSSSSVVGVAAGEALGDGRGVGVLDGLGREPVFVFNELMFTFETTSPIGMFTLGTLTFTLEFVLKLKFASKPRFVFRLVF